MKFYRAILFFLIFAAENTYADSASVTQTADFGTVIQTAERTVARLGTDGVVTWDGGSGSGSARQGIIRYDVNCGVTHELQMPNGISGGQSGENCEFSLIIFSLIRAVSGLRHWVYWATVRRISMSEQN